MHASGQLLLFSAFSFSRLDIFGECAPVGQSAGAAALSSIAIIALLQKAQKLRLRPQYQRGNCHGARNTIDSCLGDHCELLSLLQILLGLISKIIWMSRQRDSWNCCADWRANCLLGRVNDLDCRLRLAQLLG